MTELQHQFAIAFAMNGGNAREAAIEAGYSEKSAKDIGRRTLALPHVQEMILNELTKLRGRSGAVGVKALVEIAQSDKAPAAARVSAARALMEHAGMLGTAKEIKESREQADDRSNVVDYQEVLRRLAGGAKEGVA
jgi:phage terminase small subunit